MHNNFITYTGTMVVVIDCIVHTFKVLCVHTGGFFIIL